MFYHIILQLLFLIILFNIVISMRLGQSLRMSKYVNPNDPIFVAGGSSGVGYEIVKQLSSLGTPVHALLRNPDSVEILNKLPKVKCFIGDANNEEHIQNAMVRRVN